MWIWTLFPWLIPQDPQPFQAPHRKPHTLCITIQAYFGAEKQKIERNTELPGLPQSVPQLLNVSVEKRGLVPTIRNYQEESMKYLALSSPSSPRYFLAQTSWGEKKSKKVKKKKRKMAESLQSVSSLWLSGCSFPGVDGWGCTNMDWWRSGFARFPPQGTGWHTQRWNTGFDLCTLEVVRRTGLHGSDQSGRIVECWWSSMGHLACINGQTTRGKHLQYMHTFMRGYKCTRHFFFQTWAFEWSSIHLRAGWP